MFSVWFKSLAIDSPISGFTINKFSLSIVRAKSPPVSLVSLFTTYVELSLADGAKFKPAILNFLINWTSWLKPTSQ